MSFGEPGQFEHVARAHVAKAGDGGGSQAYYCGSVRLGETLEEARKREERTREETSRLEAEQDQLEAARRGLEGRLADTNAELAGLHEQFQKDRAGWDRERRLLHKLLENLQEMTSWRERILCQFLLL